MDLSLVKTFWTVAALRSYTAAARRLNLTPSAVTKHVRRLERQLGVELIEHDNASVVHLTPSGRRFHQAAGPLLDQAERARAAARGASAGPRLRIGLPADGTGQVRLIDKLRMREVAARVRDEFPGIQIHCCEIPFDALAGCLPEGRVDLLWTIAPVRHPAVVTIPLDKSSDRVVVVDSRHPSIQGDHVDVAVVLDEAMLYSPGAPDEWMAPFWFGDLRARNQARLVEVDITDTAGAMRQTLNNSALMGTFAPVLPHIGTRLRGVRVSGAEPLQFHLARRRADRRLAVDSLQEALDAIVPATIT